MKLLLLMFIYSMAYASQDTKIYIESDANINAQGHGQYIATKDSRFCKDRIRDESGNRISVPKRRYVEFSEENGMIFIPAYLESKCHYKKLSNEIAFYIPKKAKVYRTLELRRVENPMDNELSCEIVEMGPRNKKENYLICNKLVVEIEENGTGVVRVKMK